MSFQFFSKTVPRFPVDRACQPQPKGSQHFHANSFMMIPSCRFLTGSEESRENRGGLFPIAFFATQKFTPSARQFVIFGFAIVVRLAPLRRDVPFLLEFQERGIQRAVVHRQEIAAGLLDAPGDAVTMQWA